MNPYPHLLTVQGDRTTNIQPDGSITQLMFDPIRVKFCTVNSSDEEKPVDIQIPLLGIDQDCSKLRNQVSQHTHENTRFNNPRNLRIVLGHACNFRCKYCSQTHAEKSSVSPTDVFAFVNLCDRTLDYSQLKLIQFWGGEPLLYWPAIKLLMREFKARIPGVGFSMVTNGSLLTREITDDILAEEEFGFILSHDGPGQHLRGIDPLRRDSRTRPLLLELATAKCQNDVYRRTSNSGRNFAVNPVITSAVVKDVASLLDLVDWYDTVFGRAIPIAESIPMIPIQAGTEQYAPCWGNLDLYEEMLVYTFQQIPIERFDNYRLLYELFATKLMMPEFEVNPTKALCFTTDPFMLTIDIDGNILPCQTFSKDSILMDGSKACTNNLHKRFSGQPPKSKIVDSLPTIHNWAHLDRAGNNCRKCPVVSFCMGGCPYLTGDAHRIDCEVKKHHFHALLRIFASRILMRKVTSIKFQKDLWFTHEELENRSDSPSE